MPTRETCVSTGTSRSPKANSSTQAAVLRPTPGSDDEVVARSRDRRRRAASRAMSAAGAPAPAAAPGVAR